MELRSDDGQATAEHIGLIAMIAIVLLLAGTAAAAASPSIVNRVVTGFQRSLCVVTGEACVTLAREPCPTLRTSKTIAQGITVASMHIGHDKVLFIERHSDGTYFISLVEGEQAGGQEEEGADTGLGSTAEVEADERYGFHVGRTYAANSPEEARALVGRLRHQQATAVSTVVDGVADLAGLEQADPSVSSYVLAGTAAGSALAKFGIGGKTEYGALIEVGARASVSGELGVRIAAHSREVTAYLTADASVGVFFNAFHNLTLPIEHTAGEETLTGSVQANNPIGIQLGQDTVAGGTVALRFGPGPKLLEVEVVGYLGIDKPHGEQQEVHVRLDPSDPAVAAAITTWRNAPTAAASFAALGKAASSSAAIDVRKFATTDTQTGHEHGASIGVEGLAFGFTYGSRSKVSDLLSESSRPVGGVWEQRLDCEVG